MYGSSVQLFCSVLFESGPIYSVVLVYLVSNINVRCGPLPSLLCSTLIDESLVVNLAYWDCVVTFIRIGSTINLVLLVYLIINMVTTR